MKDGNKFKPFNSNRLEEIPLRNAPLARVYAQIHFSPIAMISRQDFIGPFQESLRRNYPTLKGEKEFSIEIGPEGKVTQNVIPGGGQIWRMLDKEENWRVSLAANFLALDTRHYTSRKEFFDRFKQALLSLERHFEIKSFDRLGVRYVNQIAGENWLKDLELLFRPEVLGILAADLEGSNAYLQESIQQTVFKIDDAYLKIRTGKIRQGSTVDPSAIEPVKEAGWILDFDMFQAGKYEFKSEAIAKLSMAFAEQIYQVFRRSVKDEFLKQCGGKI